jgi:DNA repair exonuclease SbcCD nuclease subunit
MKIIVTADWHLRGSRPRCRIDDDWEATQFKALNQITKYAYKYKCAVAVVGDVFDTAAVDVPFSLLTKVQEWAAGIPGGLYLLAGNHDLPYHKIENINRSAIGILRQSFNCFSLPAMASMTSLYSVNKTADKKISAFDFGTEDKDCKSNEILFLHRLTFPDVKSVPPNVNADTAPGLLKEWKQANLIFTGDYHKAFHYENKGRHVINPGCLIRQSANEKDYSCGVYLVDVYSNEVTFLPIEDDAELVTDEYLREQDERENRIEAFVDSLKNKEAISLDFIKNVETRLKENKQLDDDTKEMIHQLVYEG